MSKSVSALDGKTHQGVVSITDQGLRGMITLRGDLSSSKIRKAATSVTGVSYPDQGQCVSDSEMGIAWMSPDELLVMVPYDKAIEAVATMQNALSGTHALVANVSDARAVIRLEGAGIRDVMAKLVPVDMASLEVGLIRRSRLAQVPAAFWFRDAETLDLICFRSVADYAFDVICRAAMPGTDVGYS